MSSPVATARVSADEVKEIVDTDLSDAQINAFINSANAIVQDNLLDANIGSATLTQIELWLAAHLLVTRDMREREVSIGTGAVTYQTAQLGLGLDGTAYGQQVKLLDYSNILSMLGKQRARIEFI